MFMRPALADLCSGWKRRTFPAQGLRDLRQRDREARELMRYAFGEWLPSENPLTPEDVNGLMDSAEQQRDGMAHCPLDRVLALLGKVREKWLDPSYAPRQAAEAALPAESGFSAEMVRLGMDAVAWTLDPANLRRKVTTELGRAGIQTNFD